MTLRIRAARPDDYDGFVRFWDELLLDQPPPPPHKWTELLCPSALFLEDGHGALAAYGLSFPFGHRGDVRQVAVDPAFRKRGVGRELMTALRSRLRAAGCTDWRLEVRASNAPAIALYESVGMRPLRELNGLRMAAADVERFGATRSGRHEVVPCAPADDVRVEDGLDLGRGQLARWRAARAPHPLLRIGDVALVQNWRDFAPDRALLFPFRSPDPDMAAHLVAATAPHADLELVVSEPPVLAALVAGGAALHDRQIEMGGPI